MPQTVQVIGVRPFVALVWLANIAWHVAVLVLLYKIWRTLERRPS
jgi:hypothetical protein